MSTVGFHRFSGQDDKANPDEVLSGETTQNSTDSTSRGLQDDLNFSELMYLENPQLRRIKIENVASHLRKVKKIENVVSYLSSISGLRQGAEVEGISSEGSQASVPLNPIDTEAVNLRNVGGYNPTSLNDGYSNIQATILQPQKHL